VRVINRNDFQVKGKLGGRRGRAKLKRKSVTVGANARETVKLKMPKKLRRVLVPRHKLTLRLALRIDDPAGNTRTVRKKVAPRLKRPRRLAGLPDRQRPRVHDPAHHVVESRTARRARRPRFRYAARFSAKPTTILCAACPGSFRHPESAEDSTARSWPWSPS
jgi:hypothetical protein